MLPELISLSASSITDLECHHKFNLHRVLNQWPKPKAQTPAQLWGIGCHKALEYIYDPKRGIPPHVDKLDFFLRMAFLGLRYLDPDVRMQEQERARKIICAYVALDEDAEYTIAVERQDTYPVRFKGVTFEVCARLDRIIQRPHKPDVIVIRDYKFGRQALTVDQIWVILVTARKMFPDFSEYVLEVDSLSKSARERVLYSSVEFGGMHEEVAAKVGRFLADTERAPTHGPLCRWCPELPTCIAHKPVDGEDLQF